MTDKVIDEINKAMAQSEEKEEDLSDAIMALPVEGATLVAARDWLNRATQYQVLKTQYDALCVTIDYNEKHGGKEAEPKLRQYRENATDLERELKHQIRAVKLIAKRYPDANTKMTELAMKPPVCQRCGQPI